ncbi:hypothetical protein [Algoriphagus zhangzhouensis]|uniref:Uncharacterized protein n=1 Tax=Algoriphagus zhangzhouensis TaxID=1073327 RepID=A0A1M7ZBV1_9BACT|nr:hypothetical protein [Algoriphagus zhangzhouensis]TDY46875.1 hypothetical protein A8938_1324 [Algoriphagus zhangzhouensis]SHO62166.1 hypothetical protein SAMN04488108_1938 [Algoriphagus zhangzhouensis]
MEKLLKAPTAAIFIYLFSSFILYTFNLTDDIFINSLLKVLGIVMYGVYPLSIGYVLTDYLPKKLEIKTGFFVFNWFYWIAMMSMVMILFDGKEVTFNGLLAIPVFYLFFAAVYVFLFAMRVLKTVQSRRKVTFGESIGMAGLIFIWPIGLWMVHPDVKRIMDTQVSNSDLANVSE